MSPVHIKTITELANLVGEDDLRHPQLYITRVEDAAIPPMALDFSFGFYMVGLIRNLKGAVQCGRKPYDFQKGTMFFLSPDQLVGHTIDALTEADGWLLFFHRAYLARHPLHQKISGLGFFDYAANEALHLSAREEQTMEQLFENIHEEYQQPIDRDSRKVVVSNIELCTTYASRFYARQFITRREMEGDFLMEFNRVLSERFASDRLERSGIPSVAELAVQLNMSAKYLGEKLKSQTGKSAQEHIQLKLVELAKVLLRQENLTVAEVAYRLGFQYPQYFSRFFKGRTGVSPGTYRIA